MYRELRKRNQVFAGLIARKSTPVSLVAVNETKRGVAEFVSGNHFAVLGIHRLWAV